MFHALHVHGVAYACICVRTQCVRKHMCIQCVQTARAQCVRTYIHTYIHMHTYMHAALPLACICIHTCRRHCRSLAMFPKVCVRCCMCVVRSCAAMPQLAASNIFETFQILVYGNNAIRRIARRCRNFLTYCCT
jgi:hypothetical protein